METNLSAVLARGVQLQTAISNEDTNTNRIIITSNDVHVDGIRVITSGMDWTYYKNNPIVLWAHAAYQPPIARATIEFEDDKAIATLEWPPRQDEHGQGYSLANTVRFLWNHGFINMASIGIIIDEYEIEPKDSKKEYWITITQSRPYEFSLVSAGANPAALRAAFQALITDRKQRRNFARSAARAIRQPAEPKVSRVNFTQLIKEVQNAGTKFTTRSPNRSG